MLGIARLGDHTRGICKCHDEPIEVNGTIITASPDHLVNERGAARVGDTVMGDCGHTGVIIKGKPDHFTNNQLIARLGDEFKGCYSGTIITASPDTF